MQRQFLISSGNTKNYPPSFAFLILRRTWSFYVFALPREAKKCTEIFNVLGPLLFCSGEQVKGPFRYGSRRGLLKVDGISF